MRTVRLVSIEAFKRKTPGDITKHESHWLLACPLCGAELLIQNYRVIEHKGIITIIDPVRCSEICGSVFDVTDGVAEME